METKPKKAKEIRKILDIRGLSFIVDRPIVNELDWQVEQGQRWVLLGANGAGKTALISTICAYNTPSDGDMYVDGNKYSETNWQNVREKIALVGSQLRQNISANEDVMKVVISGKFAQINYWGDVSNDLIKEAYSKMKRLQIEHLVDSNWSYISQGERQKVLIARALMLKPSVMFLDEPSTGLDPVARKKFVEFLNKFSADKRIPAIVLATHYVEEIPDSFTHALIIKKGKVMASGEIKKVLTSENLSLAYNAECKLKKGKNGYSLVVE